MHCNNACESLNFAISVTFCNSCNLKQSYLFHYSFLARGVPRSHLPVVFPRVHLHLKRRAGTCGSQLRGAGGQEQGRHRDLSGGFGPDESQMEKQNQNLRGGEQSSRASAPSWV